MANGLIIKAEAALNLQNTESLRIAIQRFLPFECSDWDALCQAIVEEYEAETWRHSLVWILGCIRKMKQFEHLQGSWNVPLRAVWNYQDEKPAYKVFRQPRQTSFIYRNGELQLPIETHKGYFEYEFHPSAVPVNQWLQCELSSSKCLTGMKPKSEGGTGGRFHMLMDERQAQTYLNTRGSENDSWFTKRDGVIKQVKGRDFATIDLVYVPPKTWVWGVDANEMYVEL